MIGMIDRISVRVAAMAQIIVAWYQHDSARRCRKRPSWQPYREQGPHGDNDRFRHWDLDGNPADALTLMVATHQGYPRTFRGHIESSFAYGRLIFTEHVFDRLGERDRFSHSLILVVFDEIQLPTMTFRRRSDHRPWWRHGPVVSVGLLAEGAYQIESPWAQPIVDFFSSDREPVWCEFLRDRRWSIELDTKRLLIYLPESIAPSQLCDSLDDAITLAQAIRHQSLAGLPRTAIAT